MKLQFRTESFNAANTPHCSNPSGSSSIASRNADGSIRNLGGYSTITSASADHRQVRFALRISFLLPLTFEGVYTDRQPGCRMER